MKARMLLCLFTAALISCFPSRSIAEVSTSGDTTYITGGTLANGVDAGPLKKTINRETLPFMVTSSGGAFDSSSFAPKVSFATGGNPEHIAVADLDGDGKPDLITTNSSGKTISVFRNTSSIGSITNSSFANKVDFATDSYPNGIMVGDLDGDGKPDLVVANSQSDTISVFFNTSTIGSVSFAAKVDFAAGSFACLVAIGDLDGDGKPDIAVTNPGSNTVSVYRNMSTIGSIAFSTKVDFVSDSIPVGIAISDMDGDGKPDIVVSNNGTNSITVFRNTSTIGNISFAAGMSFATDSSPIDMVVGDLDGDGKPDVAVSDAGTDSISVFRNTSTIGSIIFATKVDLATGGKEAYCNAIGDLDGDGKPDLVVSNRDSNIVSVFRNTSVTGSISFANKVDVVSGDYGVAIGDLDGDGKPDLAVANYDSNTVSVLRNTMADILPIELSSFVASCSGSEASLRWTTVTEVDDAGFDIERRPVNAQQWTKIGSVAGAGTSNSPHNYSYTDNIGTAGTYSYRLKQIDHDGAFVYSQAVQVTLAVPKALALSQNYPEPFNPSTTIQFTVPTAGRATLKVYSVLGQEVATLFNDDAAAGVVHQVQFNGSNLASGIYFSRLGFEGKMQVKKMLLLK